MNKWNRRILRAAEKAEWKVRQGSKHIVLYPTDGGRPIVLSNAGSIKGHGSAQSNYEATLRRRGLDV